MKRKNLLKIDGKGHPVIVAVRPKNAKLPTTEMYKEEVDAIKAYVERQKQMLAKGRNATITSISKYVRAACREYAINHNISMPSEDEFQDEIGSADGFVIWRKSSVARRNTRRKQQSAGFRQ